MSDYYDDGPEFPGETLRAFCDNYAIHGSHAYRAINGNTYLCSGFDAEDLAEMDRLAAEPPCEHGLSAYLCAGPMHYPPDSDFN